MTALPARRILRLNGIGVFARLEHTVGGQARRSAYGFAPDDFAGPGEMDRDRFRRYLALLWLRNRQVGVTLGPLEVELVGPDRARVNFTAAARGGTGWMPERAEVYQVKTGWRLEDDEWKLISADWE